MKHIEFAYSESYWLAYVGIQEFYNEGNHLLEEFWNDCEQALVKKLTKSEKWTILHDWIMYVFDFHYWYAEGHFEKEDVFEMRVKIIEDAGYSTGEYPDFDSIKNCDYCEECEVCNDYNNKISAIDEFWDEAVFSLVHTVFHLFMMNRKFLRDFNTHIAKCIQLNILRLITEYPNEFQNGKIERVQFPRWLERALLFRDKGVCSICRKDISGTLNLENRFAIDHIVPISKFGNNDPTNLQILCIECNGKKSNKSNRTSGIDIPLWNL
jgi:hypothetical protein